MPSQAFRHQLVKRDHRRVGEPVEGVLAAPAAVHGARQLQRGEVPRGVLWRHASGMCERLNALFPVRIKPLQQADPSRLRKGLQAATDQVDQRVWHGPAERHCCRARALGTGFQRAAPSAPTSSVALVRGGCAGKSAAARIAPTIATPAATRHAASKPRKKDAEAASRSASPRPA
jgi:hypothetical protein